MQALEQQSAASNPFDLPPDIVELMQRQPLNNLGGRAVVPEGDVDNEDDDE